MIAAGVRLAQQNATQQRRIDEAGRTGSKIIEWPRRASAIGFSGKAYAPNGHPTTGLNSDSSKAWIKWDYDAYAFSQETGPAPDPWPSNEVWFEKAAVYGNVVVLGRV